jgi:ATP-dependent RNA helicase DeaD
LESFNELNLNPSLKRAIEEMGFVKPSPIQAQALPILLGPKTDFIGLAATGTGKTAAFTLPLLEKIDSDKKAVQAIILCPTRELCMQVSEQVSLIAKYMNVRALPIYGGAAYEQQFSGLKRKPHVVVGTPGRVIDHLKRGTLTLDEVRIVVLDEADEMISMGFREAMESILGEIPREHCLKWMFSATMSSAVRRVADQFLTNPKSVQANRAEVLSNTVEQIFYTTAEANKPEVLCKLIDEADDFYGIVFCQTKVLVADLMAYLVDRGYKADCLHGDMSQNARETAMRGFRDRRKRIMVCTDVAARGLDVKDVTHVINYSLPREPDIYVHRIGRTGRSGKTGIAMSLVTRSHFHLLQKIERATRSKFKEGTIPSRRLIGMKKINQMLAPFSDQPGFTRAIELMDQSWKDVISNMTGEEVAARFMALLFPYLFNEKPQAKMTRTEATQDERPERKKPKNDKDYGRERKRDFRRTRGGGNYPPRRDRRPQTF